VNGKTVGVERGEGKILVKRPGQSGFHRLTEDEVIPVGTIIDARNGKVRLVSIDRYGREQSAFFFGGVFRVTQLPGSRLTVLHLIDTEFGGCEPAAGAATASAAHGTGKLWGSGHGNFRTEGNDGSATVRGTIWFTEDRCAGTFFKVQRGIVRVRDFIAHKSLSLPAGKSYLTGSG
jgi:hypothetical protein